jgi:hypothetical protein
VADGVGAGRCRPKRIDVSRRRDNRPENVRARPGCGILGGVVSPLATFAGLLDRSVQDISTLAADARAFDASRIGRIADIWDNNTFPLVSAACALRPLRARRALAGLLWMADLGASRRALMIDLDPGLDSMLPPARPQRLVHRDYENRVHPGELPLTAETVAALATDYDLPGASVRSLAVWPGATALRVQLTLAAQRRFEPADDYVASDGSRRPWPPASLIFTFLDASDLRFDADDRIGMAITHHGAAPEVVIGRAGRLRASSASVWPDDPRWYESAAGRAADTATPQEEPARRPRVRTSSLTREAIAAAQAIQHLMLRIRLVHYYPDLATRVPLDEICDLAAGAGGAILAAADRRGSGRAKEFADLAQRWQRVPPDREPTRIPSGPTVLRYVSYAEPHLRYDVHRAGSTVLIGAVPTPVAAAWRLAGETITSPSRFRINAAAFDGVPHMIHRTGTLTIGDSLVVQR